VTRRESAARRSAVPSAGARDYPIYSGGSGVVGDHGRDDSTVAGDHGGRRRLRDRNRNERCLCLGSSICVAGVAPRYEPNSGKTAEEHKKRANRIFSEAFPFGSSLLRRNTGCKTSWRKQLPVAVAPMWIIHR
jgi:hypothetical protein